MMNISLLLDMAADTFGDRVAVGAWDGGLTAWRLRRLARWASPVTPMPGLWPQPGSMSSQRVNGSAIRGWPPLRLPSRRSMPTFPRC